MAGTGILAVGGMEYDDIAGAWYQRRQVSGTVALASAARTSTTTSSVMRSYGKKSGIFEFFPTVRSGSTTFVFHLLGSTPSPGAAVTNVFTGTMTVAANHVGLVFIGEGAVTPTNDSANNVDFAVAFSIAMPALWQVSMTPSDGTSVTYSVPYMLS